MSFRGFLWIVAGLTPVYLVLAAVLPPADDEVYYWCWAQQLQLSYYDHPPMTAYMIRAATFLFGDTLFAIRLPAVVSTLTVLLVMGWLTRPRTLLPLVLFTPLFTFGAVLVTPDTPLLMFWALYLAWLVKVHERLTPAAFEAPGLPPAHAPRAAIGLWMLGGVILGCGILGKYTTGLAMMAGFASFLIAIPIRRWFFGYVAHGLTAVVVTLPILIHNIRYDFVPLLYQWKHSMSHAEPGVIPFVSFFGVQILLFGLLPFAVFAWTVRHWRELMGWTRRGEGSSTEPGLGSTLAPQAFPVSERINPACLRVCACLFGLPFAFFLYKATRGHLEGNWALAVYIAAWPLAAVMFERIRVRRFARPLVWASFATPAACVLLIGIHLIHPFTLLSPARDRITRQWSKDDLAREVARTVRGSSNEPIFATSYQWTALLRFHHVDARQIDGITRPSHFTQYPEDLSGHDRVLVFAEGFLPKSFVAGFGPPRIVGRFPLTVRGQDVGTFWLIEYVKPSRG